MRHLESVTTHFRRCVGRWTSTAYRWGVIVLLVTLAVTAAGGYVLSTQLRINTDNEDMLSAELPFRRDSKALDDAFPQFSDNLLIVVEAATPDLADDAALALAARMRDAPTVFGHIHDPAGEPFFRQNGLLYLEIGELEDLADRLAEAQPFLSALWRDPSLRGLAHMVDLIADAVLEGRAGPPVAVVPLLDAVAGVAEAQREGRFSEMSWQRLMQGEEGEGNANTVYRRFLVSQPPIDFASLSPAADVMAAVRTLTREIGLTPERGVRVRLTGSAALNHEELQSVEEGMGWAGLISLTLVLVLLSLAFRSWVLVVSSLVTLIVGLVWTASFGLLAIGTFNLISVAFAVLFIGLSVDFAIHFVLRFREALSTGVGEEEALREAGEQLGGALTLCAVCAALAFYGFLPTDYRGLAELGLIAGTGMFIALFANLTLLPAMIKILPALGGVSSANSTWVSGLADWVHGRERAVIWGALVLAAVSALLMQRTSFDFDPMNLKDPTTESVATTLDLINDSRTNPYVISILEKDRLAADTLTKRLEALPEVASVENISAFVPTEQDEKLEIIADLALFLSPALSGASTETSDEGARQAALASLITSLARLSGQGDENAAKAATRAKRAIGELGAEPSKGAAAAAEFERRLMVRLPGRIGDLKQSLAAEEVSFDDLPASVVSRYVATDGRVRLRVNPRDDLRDREALKHFVAVVRAVAPRASGSPVIILEAGRTVIGAFVQAGAIAIIGISLILVLLAAGWRELVLVFSPLLLAGMLTCAVAVVFGFSFNFANIIVLPLLFGLGVASTIHIVWREREEVSPMGAFTTSTPRAVFYSALTTIGSFASIAISGHPGTASMGSLLTIAISLTLACTLVLTPALLATGLLGQRGSAGRGNREG